jgi:hypothetical protein
MKLRLIAVAAILLSLGGVAYAHRLDEYLQATILSVERDHVEASMRLISGVAVRSSVIVRIDSNRDGVISKAEQWAYAERVLGDLSLTVDGNSLRPRTRSPPAFSWQRSRNSGFLRHYPRFGICCHPGRIGTRPLGSVWLAFWRSAWVSKPCSSSWLP